MRRRTALGVLSATLLVVAVVGCASDGGPTDDDAGTPTTSAASPRHERMLTRDAVDGVDVWTGIGQSRHLEGTNRITVPIRFESDGPVTVTGIAMRTPHFEHLPPEPKESLLPAGREVDLQVDLGPARCGPLGPTAAEVELTVRHGDARPTELALPVPTWLLDDLRERECTLAQLADAVDVRFGSFSPPRGIRLETEIVVERRATSAPIVVERVAGSVLLTLEPDVVADPVATLAAAQAAIAVPVDVTATRCDAHGIAGSQKTFVFSVWLAVGDAPAVYVEVRPDPELEEAMRSTLDACVDAGT